MTIFQLLALVIAGPVGLIALMRMLLVIIHGQGEFHIVEAFILLACVAAILVAFFGVQ